MAVIVSLVALAVVIVVLWASTECTTVSVEDIEAQIQRELPAGSDVQQINAWFDANDIRHEGSAPIRAGGFSDLVQRSVPSGTLVLVGIIDDAGRGGILTTKHIHIYCLLDEEGRLDRAIVVGGQTGL